MSVINISLTKISAERKSVPKGRISIKNNIKITGVDEVKMGIDKARTSLKVGYVFATEYAPGFADVALEGDVFLLEDSKTAKDIMDKWKKEKTLDKSVAADVMNRLMTKCSIETILLAKELGLPSPIPMPKIRAKEQSAPPKKSSK